jgi:tRNA modification GTPase
VDLVATIVAVSSPPGRSRRAIIRCAGPGARHIASAILGVAPSGTVAAHVPFGQRRLPVVSSWFPAERSFTGQDTLELHLPGNPVLVDRVLEAMIEVGDAAGVETRHAHPGEFSGRAYLTGRLSLIEAEGIALKVAATSDAHLQAANALMDGSLGAWVRGAADELATLLALVEAGIDFTDEEDVVAIARGELNGRLAEINASVDAYVRNATGTEVLDGIPRVVLAGPPNVGKSTLFNALIGDDRVLVSSLAGTTRDVIEEPLHVPCGEDGAEVLLLDVAGLEAGGGLLERAMQDHARSAISTADLVVWCTGPSDSTEFREDGLLVMTKRDLAPDESIPAGAIAVSARSGEGIDALRTAIGERLLDRAVSLSADVVVMTSRHATAMRNARQQMVIAIEMLSATEGERLNHPELIADLLRTALDHLGEIVGIMTPDEVLDRVFSSFCVGK